MLVLVLVIVMLMVLPCAIEYKKLRITRIIVPDILKEYDRL